MIMYTASGKDICLRQTLHYNNYEFSCSKFQSFEMKLDCQKISQKRYGAFSILERLGSEHNAKVSQCNKDVEIITAIIIFFIGYWYLLISLSNIQTKRNTT